MNPDDQIHIASLVVRTLPENGERVAAAIDRMPGAEVAAREGGRLVVVLEAPDEGAIVAAIDAITPLTGVLSACLVYHQSERAETLDEEIEP